MRGLYGLGICTDIPCDGWWMDDAVGEWATCGVVHVLDTGKVAEPQSKHDITAGGSGRLHGRPVNPLVVPQRMLLMFIVLNGLALFGGW